MKNIHLKRTSSTGNGFLSNLKKERNPQLERLLIGMFRELSEEKQEVILDIISDLYAIEKKPL